MLFTYIKHISAFILLCFFLSLGSCSSGKRYYQTRAYKKKSKKMKLHKTKNKVEFSLYRERTTNPISN